MADFTQQYRNAKVIIAQIKNNEWELTGCHEYEFKATWTCLKGHRNGTQLWLANGPMFCGICDKPWELGIFGVWVWYAAARKRVKEIEHLMRRKPSDLSKDDN